MHLSSSRLAAPKAAAPKVAVLGAAVFLAASGIAAAKVIPLHASLAPGAGVTSHGSGQMTGSYSTVTHRLKWHVDYKGMTSPLTMAHFHGPAQPGQNAPVLVPIVQSHHSSPIDGGRKITASAAKTILNGRSYVNLHTKQYPLGELRGQVMAAP